MFVYLKTPDVETQGPNEGERLVGGEVRAREGSFYFFYFFLYHIFVVKVQEIAWSASYGENKTQKRKRTNKGKNHHQALHLGSVPVPGPHTGTKLKKSTSKETLP